MREIDTGTMDSDARLDWCFDWSTWLTDGDTIASHELTAEGVIIDDQGHTDTTVTAWLQTTDDPPQSASVVCRIVTTQGRRDERTLRLHIADR